MINICVNGSPGTGKTTLSKILLKNEKTYVVHLDNLLDKLKKVLPKTEVQVVEREHNEVLSQLNKESRIYKFIHSKLVYDMYEKIRFLYMKREIKRLYNECVAKEMDYFVVEGIYADIFSDVIPFDYKIFILSMPEDRRRRICLRDHKSSIDSGVFSVLTEGVNLETYDIVVNNYGSYEEYIDKIELLSDNIKENRGIVKKLTSKS